MPTISLGVIGEIKSREESFFDKFYKPREYESYSSISSAARCPRKYFLSSVARLRPAGGSHLALKYGTAMHEAIPEILSKGDLAGAMKGFDNIWSAEDDANNDQSRNTGSARVQLAKYYSMRRDYEYELLLPPQPTGSLGVIDNSKVRRSPYELAFAVMLPGLDVPYCGFIDAVARHKRTGLLYVLEYKTSYQMGAQFSNSWSISPQLISYAAVVQQLFNEQVAGAVVEGFQTAKTTHNHMTIPVYITEQMMVEEITRISILAQQMREYGTAKYFPKFFSGCNPYSQFGQHGYKCDYEVLCKEKDPNLMLGMFNVRPETPFGIDLNNVEAEV